jgi:hypothetical protein
MKIGVGEELMNSFIAELLFAILEFLKHFGLQFAITSWVVRRL